MSVVGDTAVIADGMSVVGDTAVVADGVSVVADGVSVVADGVSVVAVFRSFKLLPCSLSISPFFMSLKGGGRSELSLSWASQYDLLLRR